MTVVVCVVAKHPRAGRVKTRLTADAGAAAALARALLDDALASAASLPWARVVLASTEPARARRGLPGVEVWPQGGGDLGRRLERALARALEHAAIGFVVGADVPAPAPLLAAARRALRDADAVLGPCDDGGFYLLGLRRGALRPGLLAGLPWSAADTLSATRARLESRGLRVALAPPWFDVDRPDDLARLAALVAAGAVAAPAFSRLAASLPRPASDAASRRG
jgi:rSAM/selenodomain-associated transferase 1